MSSLSLIDLPQEIYYLIFRYLKKVHVSYAFLKFNYRLSLAAQYFIGNQLDLTKVNDNLIFEHCLHTLLPSIGANLRHLSIGYPKKLSNYIEVKNYCPYLETLAIYSCGPVEDIRCYANAFVHGRLASLTLVYNDKIVGEQIAARLLNKDENNESGNMQLAVSLTLHLSSADDLVLLKRYAESSYLADGFYMIECMSNGEWLTDGKDDLCTMSKGLPRERIFSINQADIDRCSREYGLYNELSKRSLTVRICHGDEDEHWPTSSILSTRRPPSSYSNSTFTFERIDNSEQFYIRPCYPRARRLQVSGQRIIVSTHNDQSTLAHRFRLHRIA